MTSEVTSTNITRTLNASTDIVLASENSKCVSTEPSKEVTAIKREYSIVGDAFYAGVNSDVAPQWLTDIITGVVESSVADGLSDYNSVVQNIRDAIDSIDVAKNTFVETVNFSSTVDGIIGARLDTLNATYDGKFATKVGLDTVVANSEFALASSVNDLRAEFNEDISSRITDVTQVFSDATSSNADSILALTTAFADQELNLSGVADAVTGIQTYVGLSDEDGNPNGTGILGRLSLVEKQTDGVIEYTTSTYDVMEGVDESDPNVNDDKLRTDALPYATWTVIKGTGVPVATTRTCKDYAVVPPASIQVGILDGTYYERDDYTDSDLDRYYKFSNNSWTSVLESEYFLGRESLRSAHTADVYIQYSVNSDGVKSYLKGYKFIKSAIDNTSPYSTDAEGYGWALISDTDTQSAYIAALNAKDLADSKRRVFVSQPFPPYDEGDLWINSTVSPKVLMSSGTSVPVGGTFSLGHWTIADEQVQDFVATIYNPESAGVRRQLDGKVEYFFYEKFTDISGATSESTALDIIDNSWNTKELRDDANGNVVYFKDTKNAYWYQASTPAWLSVTDTSIYQALQDASKAQGAADGKVSHLFAWGGNSAPADYTVEDSNGQVLEVVDSSHVLYWYTEGILFSKGPTGWSDKVAVPTSPGGEVYVSDGDILTVLDTATGDLTVFTFNGASWQKSSASGIMSKSKWFVDLDNDVRGSNGLVASALNDLEVSGKAYADASSLEVESKFAYNSTVILAGSMYKAGFGLDTTGSVQIGTDSATGAPVYSSNFWVNAKTFTLKNPDYPNIEASFTVTNTGITLGVEHTEATRNEVKGPHATSNTYLKGDVVTVDGSSYMALLNVPAGIPIGNATYWVLFAEKGSTGAYTDYLFTRKGTQPLNPGGSDTWYTDVTDVPSGSGKLWSIKKVVGAGGSPTAYSDIRVIDSPIVREVTIYSNPTTGSAPSLPNSSYNLTNNTLTVGSSNWSLGIKSITANNQKVYATTALVLGNSTQNSVAVAWSSPAVYSHRVDGISPDALTVTTTAQAGGTLLEFSNGTRATIPNGESSGVKIIYAYDPSGSGASFSKGSRTYVNYYEWTGSAPTSVPAGLTYTLFEGKDGDSSGVLPIYADSPTGSNATFSFNGQSFVNFYEWDTTAPATVPPGLTYVKFVGDDGADGAIGDRGVAGASLFTLNNIANVTVAPNAVTKSSGSGAAWDAGAKSTESYSGGVFATASFGNSGSNRAMFGLSNSTYDSSATYQEIDYAIYVSSSSVKVYESGINKGSFASLSNDEIFSVVSDGLKVVYLRNGVVFYTSLTAPSGPYHFRTSHVHINQPLSNISFGPSGVSGTSTYFHVAYADDLNGSGFSQSPNGKEYIGTYVDNIPNDASSGSNLWKWQLVKGSDGANGTNGTNGIAGTNGANGKTSYLHIAYANSPNGVTGFSTSDSVGKVYIGQYTDFTLADSNSPSAYKWTRIRGIDGTNGINGTNGAVGPKGADGVNTYFHIAYADNASGGGFSQSPTNKKYIGTYVDSIQTDAASSSNLWKWQLVKGTDGLNGSNGVAGTNGSNGQTSYFHVAYANNSTGSSGFSTTDPSNKTYMGTYTDFTLADSNTPSKYKWQLVKGANGTNGINGTNGAVGPKGADGVSTYFHIAYADNASGGGFSQSPTNKKYIGTYVDTTAADAASGSALWKWQLVKGTDGLNGTNGIAGTNGTNGQTSYFHVAYANSSNGSSGFSTSVSTGKTYMGTYTDFTLADSNTPSKYAWSLIKGDDGYVNLLRNDSWVVGGTGTQGRFAANGSSAENRIISGVGPFKIAEPLWNAYGTDGNGDGGWNTQSIEIDHTRSYRSVIWAKHTGTNATTYHGCLANRTNNLNGTVNTNPYFWAGDLPQNNKWYLIVGIIHGSGYTGGASGLGGIYDPDTGKKVLNATDYKNAVGAPVQNQRVYRYYASGAQTHHYFARPRFEEINGEEYSIQEILGRKAVDGQDGADGVSYAGTSEYYKLTNSTTSPSNGGSTGSGWSSTVQTPTASNKYLWNYNVNRKSDGSTSISPVSLITQYVSDGRGIQSISEAYKISNSSTTPPSGTYAATFSGAGSMSAAYPFMWNRTTTAFTDGSPSHVVFNLIAARGNDGARGLQGLQGADGLDGVPGAAGVSTYFHIAYADNASGGGFSQNPTGKAYIGTYVNTTQSDAGSGSSLWKWQLVRGANGANGAQGIPGKDGVNGQTHYLHIAYSNSSNGTVGFSTTNATNKSYIGQYTDFTINDSNTPSKYAWTKIKGENGSDGSDGVRGATVLQYAGNLGNIAPGSVSSSSLAGYWNASASSAYAVEIAGDSLVVTNTNTTSGWTHVFEYNGSSWSGHSTFVVNGNQIVKGTVNADAIIANTVMRSPKIEFVGDQYMRISAAEGFGSNNQFIEWFGKNKLLGGATVDYSALTESNAVTYLKTNGDAYFGGSIISGALSNGLTSSTLASDSSITIGPFGTNGGDIVLNCSVSMSANYSRLQSGPGSTPPTPSVILILEENVSGVWYQRKSEAFTGTASGRSFPEGGGQYAVVQRQSLTKSFTYTDNSRRTANRTFRAKISGRTNFFTQSPWVASQYVSINSREE